MEHFCGTALDRRMLAEQLRLRDETSVVESTGRSRTGTWGMTWSTRCAAACAMRRAPHEGQKPRRLQEKSTSLSWPQSAQRRRRKPCATQRLSTRGSPRRCPGLQAQVREDLLDDRRLQDRSDDLQLAAAVRAVLEVDLEDPFEQPGPAHSHRLAMRAVRLALGGLGCLSALVRPLRHHRRTQLGVGCQHAVEADQVQAWPRHEQSKGTLRSPGLPAAA